MTKLHLDTDIGGDIDDLCALAMLLKWPGLDLTGITTVADEDGRRAGYAKYAQAMAGREAIPVAAGADVSLGCYRFKPGYPKEEDYWPEPMSRHPGKLDEALELLKKSVEQGLIIAGIGPYANLYLLERPGANPRPLTDARRPSGAAPVCPTFCEYVASLARVTQSNPRI